MAVNIEEIAKRNPATRTETVKRFRAIARRRIERGTQVRYRLRGPFDQGAGISAQAERQRPRR